MHLGIFVTPYEIEENNFWLLENRKAECPLVAYTSNQFDRSNFLPLGNFHLLRAGGNF